MSGKLLILHSDKSNNNVFTLDNRIVGDYQLKSFVATNNLYNITDLNNKIYVGENDTNITITLTNGYYYASDLKTHLQTKMNEVMTGTISVSFDEITNKFTITDTIVFSFDFLANTTNSARKLIGFNEKNTSQSLTHVSDIPIDLNPHKNIFITITQDDNRSLEGIDFFNCSFVVNGHKDFGDVLRYVDIDNFTQIVKFKNTKKINVSFHDASNNNIDLNSEYQIIFRKIS